MLGALADVRGPERIDPDRLVLFGTIDLSGQLRNPEAVGATPADWSVMERRSPVWCIADGTWICWRDDPELG